MLYTQLKCFDISEDFKFEQVKLHNIYTINVKYRHILLNKLN